MIKGNVKDFHFKIWKGTVSKQVNITYSLKN